MCGRERVFLLAHLTGRGSNALSVPPYGVLVRGQLPVQVFAPGWVGSPHIALKISRVNSCGREVLAGWSALPSNSFLAMQYEKGGLVPIAPMPLKGRIGRTRPGAGVFSTSWDDAKSRPGTFRFPGRLCHDPAQAIPGSRVAPTANSARINRQAGQMRSVLNESRHAVRRNTWETILHLLARFIGSWYPRTQFTGDWRNVLLDPATYGGEMSKL